MKLHTRKDAESGQAIVLVALFMVVLLAFTGLAIDGGGLFFLNRDAQNAVDASVLAAAYAKCVGGDVDNAGLTAARENGFNNDGTSNNVFVRDGAKNQLTAEYLPVDVDPDVNLVQVEIQANKPSFFIQIVYPAPLSVQARATAYCQKAFDSSTLPGVLATGLCDNGVYLRGNDMEFIGTMHSNGHVQFQPGGAQMKFGDGSVVTGTASPYADDNGNVDWSNITKPTTSTPQIGEPLTDVLNLPPEIYGPGGEVYEMIKSTTGKAYHIKASDLGGNGTWSPSGVLEGLYYVEGKVSVGNQVDIGPEGVTIVTSPGNGNVDENDHDISFSPKGLSGGTQAQFYTPIMDVTPSGVRYPGIILYSTAYNDSCTANNKVISFSGPNNDIYGILYAPYTTIKVSGSRNKFVGGLISHSIDMSGSTARIIVDPSLIPPRPPMVQYAQ